MTKDVVCGMKVNEGVALQCVYRGAAYYFCSPVCRALFEREPENYLRQEPAEAKKDETPQDFREQS